MSMAGEGAWGDPWRRLLRQPPPLPPGRPSAVLASLWPNQSDPGGAPEVLLIRRTRQGGPHDDQWALPGGGWEAGDADPAQTAWRESEEEVGLDPAWGQVVGYLPAVAIPVSGYSVVAVVAWLPDGRRERLRPSPAEVAQVAFASLDRLRGALAWERRRRGGRDGLWPSFALEEGRVWGATALILLSLLRRLPPTWGRAR